MLTAIEGMRKEIRACSEPMAEAEVRISSTEDDVISLQDKVNTLEVKNTKLEDKVEDLEARSRLSNLRVVNLPEDAERGDACAFLDKWIPDVLVLAPLNSKCILERAHRIGQRRDANAPPRTLIMQFLNYKDRMVVTKAARAKQQILFKDQQVRFYPDLAAGVHKRQKMFDNVRQKLRILGIRYGMLLPARLLVTYKDKSHTFENPSAVENFIERIAREEGRNLWLRPAKGLIWANCVQEIISPSFTWLHVLLSPRRAAFRTLNVTVELALIG
ncbi:uncharacterized protein LOC115023950 [Cottoperca gobio]|uniref:Uncharacterized protein LOC115023950 n=1 Tax=Cottoperca gobio TaxID=56716 RepID=A0A6J2RMF7_COTGO|nr:uncharacterized protein LOC115023950 [Cottoperca gobio]